MTTERDLSCIYGLLGSMYLCKPLKDAVENWRALVRGVSSPVLDELREALNAIRRQSEQEMEDLLWDYTKLFIGPYKLPCPPWESAYTSPKRLMMQEAYDAVTDIYRQAKLSIGDPGVLQDHVGAELSFLAVLYGRMDAMPESTHETRELAERFLRDHLRKWIPAFSLDLERSADSPFYKALGRTTRNLVAAA